LLHIAAQAQADFSRDTSSEFFFAPKSRLDTASVKTLVQWFAPPTVILANSNLQMPHLHAQYWFPSLRGNPASDTVQPARGKVSLWILLNAWCSYDFRMYTGQGGCWAKEADAVQQWLAMYDASQLSITVITDTRMGSLWEGTVSAAREAERARWFVQDYHHLPVTVAVHETKMPVLPTPDARRMDTVSEGDGIWHGGYSWSRSILDRSLPDWNGWHIREGQEYPSGTSGVIITDRDGRLVLAEGWGGYMRTPTLQLAKEDIAHVLSQIIGSPHQ
jgi:hypothetical protein